GNDIEGSTAGASTTGAGAAVSSAISGTPFSEGNALTGPGSTGSYVYSDGQTRTPVGPCLAAAGRRGPRHRCPRPPVAGRATQSGGRVPRRSGRRFRDGRSRNPGRHL